MHRIFQGDCLEVLKTLESESVQCVVTSPPYYGLRDYGTGTWEGGSSSCDHQKSELRRGVNLAQSPASTRGGAKKIAEVDSICYRDICAKCGAARADQQIGLEETPAEYVQKLVDVFAEVWRVLRPDGTLWLNLGDSYASIAGGYDTTGSRGTSAQISAKTQAAVVSGKQRKPPVGYKPKDLLGIPWRVAFALQDFGWYLRQEIIWHKSNPMPESVTDRCTKSHEHIFLLSKSPRYFFDSDAIREPHQDRNVKDGVYLKSAVNKEDYQPNNQGFYGQGMVTHHQEYNPNGRNKRSVWTVSTKPFPEAHFATFPEDLIKPMILAGTSEKGACASCGGPYKRILEKGFTSHNSETESAYANGSNANRLALLRQAARDQGEEYSCEKKTVGWQKSCICPTEEIKPCVVLDPFAGAGTTLLVALKHHREAIGIELNPEYISIAERRLRDLQPKLF